MDKREYFLTIITTTILLCLVIPMVTYILIPLAAILIYAVNVYHKKTSEQDDLDELHDENKSILKNKQLDY